MNFIFEFIFIYLVCKSHIRMLINATQSNNSLNLTSLYVAYQDESCVELEILTIDQLFGLGFNISLPVSSHDIL